MQIFSKRLISLRKERGLTQADLAKLVQKQRSTISGWETEGKEPDLSTVCQFAKFFGVTTDYLLGYSEERNNVEWKFYSDKINFEKDFKAMPADMRPVVAHCFDNFYSLLSHDVQLARPERLELYRDLLQKLVSYRNDIRKLVDSCNGALAEPSAFTELMEMQNQLKSELSIHVDRLIQADMDIAFEFKKKEKFTTSAI